VEPTELDLQYMRDLLTLLAEFGVARFSTPEFSLELPVAAPRIQVVPTTVTAAPGLTGMTGFDGSVIPLVDKDHDGWRHPSLWQAVGGAPLGFDGSRK